MRIALIANEASGGGFDPEPLVATMRRHGADVSVCGPDPEDLDVVPSWEPERIAMAGGACAGARSPSSATCATLVAT